MNTYTGFYNLLSDKSYNDIFTHYSKDNNYSIILAGNIYNIKELKQKLLSINKYYEKESPEELILDIYINLGTKYFKDFNGAFSFVIWDNIKKEILLCRDHLGICPLYYSIINGTSIIFSTNISSILSYENFVPIIDNNGICELFGIGPAHTTGLTVFKNIFEIKPAHYAVFNSNGLKTYKYWELETKEHIDTFEQTCEKTKYLLEDSIYNQLNCNLHLCAMLSGGLDSSIIVAYASKYCLEKNLDPLKTLSVNYVDNDKNFIKSDFTPDLDSYYINIMQKKFNTNHTEILIDTPELIDSLEDAMIARGTPGMADIDSSMLLFCKKIKSYAPIALSGECSDEIFAGYPWFFREDALNSNTFPWSIAIDERQYLLNRNLCKKINLKSYIDNKYSQSISNINFSFSDSKETKQKRIISYLTLNWFMQTLLDRASSMSSFANIELRVPFCDYRLVQYLWNVPWEMKAYENREKGLLRHIVKDLLPDEIINRKKSPYPKTHNPSYLNLVKQELTKIIYNSNSPIHNIVDKQYVIDIIKTDGKSFTRPWFGQLMTGPQLMAYLIQINMWLEKYNLKLEIR